ncbi:MAG: DegV family protein [Clostridia bacterium]|nr:DegV family protein [Clostridia bacterium]
MKPIKIITDTASDIDLSLAKEKGIHIIPIYVTIDGVTYKDRYELTPEEFYKKFAQCKELPKTSQITVNDHYEEFKKFSDDYTIIYCCISAKASGTAQSAHMAKQMILEENADADINIVNCNTFSYGYGLWVLEAAAMAEQGKSKEEIISYIEKNSDETEIVLVVDDLNYLEKGGRIKPATKLVANVLDLKPILTVDDGLIGSKDKVRGSKKVNKKLLDILVAEAREDYDQTIAIFQVNCPDRAEILKQQLLENTQFKNTVIVSVGPTIGVHTGPGTVAYGFLKK